jgi:hypothetical protein
MRLLHLSALGIADDALSAADRTKAEGERAVRMAFPAAEALARALERLPVASLTREEVWLLKTDKVAGGLPTPADLGIAARPLRKGLPATLRAGR